VRACVCGPWAVDLPVCVWCVSARRRPRALANALFAERGKQGKAETSTWVVGAEAAPRCASRAVSAGGRVGRAGGRSEERSGGVRGTYRR
jgi:hypothetical protein